MDRNQSLIHRSADFSLLQINTHSTKISHLKTETPTKGSYSSLCVVITKKQYWSGYQGYYPTHQKIYYLMLCSFQ